jgi:hypothetical protein
MTSPAPQIFDCHSHWGTAKGHIFRTPEELARQEKIWKTKGRNWAEAEMMDYMRANKVRTILDLSFHKGISRLCFRRGAPESRCHFRPLVAV